MEMTIQSELVDIVIDSSTPFTITDNRKRKTKIISEPINSLPDTKLDTTYGYPLDNIFVANLYNALIANGFIDAMDYNSFRYYFNCNASRPKILDKIHWLKSSREGVRILLLAVFDKFISKDRKIRKLQVEEIERLTPLFWLDHKEQPLKPYKKSGGYSRTDAGELEEILVRILNS